MPQIKSQFTSEQKLDFEEKYNLGVYSHEAMIEVLMQQNEALEIAHDRIDELQTAQKELEKLHNGIVDEVYNPKIDCLERIQQLEESLETSYRAIERLGAFAHTKDCDAWQLCRLDIDKLKDHEKEDLFNR